MTHNLQHGNNIQESMTKGFNKDILHLSHPRKDCLYLGLEDGLWIKF
jgi:hypothetical protein